MTQPAPENFFDGSVRSGAPSAKLSDIDDFVYGVVEDQFTIDQTDFATKKVLTDERTGAVLQQLVIVLQTEQRGWANVAKVPVVDPTQPLNQQVQKDPSEDDGKRAVYVKPFTNLHAAIGRATAAVNGGKPKGLANGATLGVKVVNLEPTTKGNPKKVFEAFYKEADAAAGFFNGAGAQQSAPAPAAQPRSTPVVEQAPAPAAQEQQVAPQATDPWGGPASNEPPF